MSVAGIDFGNLSMLISQTSKGGIDVILNGASNRQTATYVSVQGKERFVGDAAASMARSNIQNTVSCMKLLVGRPFDNPDVQREISRCGYNAIRLPHGGVGFNINYNGDNVVLSVEHILAMVLIHAKEISFKANNGLNIGDAVLSVPNWFTDSQRRGILSACEIASLNCLKVTNDSTAIALSYGIFKSAKKLFSETEAIHVMFIDLGYSGSCVSVVDFIQGNMHVRSSVCDRQLGGRDFDDVIIDLMTSTFQKKTGVNVRGNKKAYLKMQASAEKAKKVLSPAGVNEANISVECLHEDKDLTMNLTKEEFETRSAHLVARLEPMVFQALHDAGLTRDQVREVEIVGGTSRINIVKKRLGEIIGLDASAMNFGLKTTMNSDEAVCRGAALQCAMLSSRVMVKPFVIIDKITYGIVAIVESEEGKSDVHTTEPLLFPAGADFPHKDRRLTFQKRNDFSVTIAYENSPRFLDGEERVIARFNIRVPPAFQNELHDIRVTFQLDKHYTVQLVSAQLMEEIPAPEETAPTPPPVEGDATTPTPAPTPSAPKRKFKKHDLEIRTDRFGVSKESINASIELEAQMANQDRMLRETSQARNDLESYVYAIRDKIDGPLKSFAKSSEKDRLKSLCTETEDWLYGDGYDSTKAIYSRKLEELHAIGDQIEKRQFENENRPSAIDNFRRQHDLSKAFVSNFTPQYEHITDEERAAIRKELSSAEAWLFEMQGKQADLAHNDDPVLTTDSINKRRNQMLNITNPIMHKPKPAPAPVPTPAPESKQGEEKKANDSKDEVKEGDAKPVPMEEAV